MNKLAIAHRSFIRTRRAWPPLILFFLVALGTSARAGAGPTGTLPQRVAAPIPGPAGPASEAIGAVAYSHDGRFLAIGGYREVWLLAAGDPGLMPSGSLGKRLAVSPRDARRPSMGRWRLPGASGVVTGVGFTPDGRWLAAAGGAPGRFGEIQLWDVAARRLVRTLRGHQDALYGLAFSPDGRTLAAAGYDRLVSLWPVGGGAPRMLKDHIDAVYAVAFSPDGRQVASAAGDRTIKVWDVATGRRVYTLSEPLAEQYTLAFSPDGHRIAAAGADKMLRVWNVTGSGGTLAHSAFAHDGAVLRLAFSPDGHRLITTGEDRRVKIWDSASLTERRVLELQPDWAPALAVSPNGKRLVVGRHDGSVVTYDAETGARLGAQWHLSYGGKSVTTRRRSAGHGKRIEALNE